jgi:hypothetical protein
MRIIATWIIFAHIARIGPHVTQRREAAMRLCPWLFPHLNSRGYQYWFLDFQPEADKLVLA